MSSLQIEKNHTNQWTDLVDKFKHQSFNFSQVILPYSNHSEKLIYAGIEKIPFKQRDPEFQLILRKEFASDLKKFAKDFS